MCAPAEAYLRGEQDARASKRPRACIQRATESTGTIARRITTPIKCRENFWQRENEKRLSRPPPRKRRAALRCDGVLDGEKRKYAPYGEMISRPAYKSGVP